MSARLAAETAGTDLQQLDNSQQTDDERASKVLQRLQQLQLHTWAFCKLTRAHTQQIPHSFRHFD
jgi:hypothetical protein